eukprot:CAMPEP_0170546592 /NCGR_PEP_ID=MMETSP0211-20121228/4951_1 /TAXON_ID=311385 /ORGANISM="Pseudokeronopsis sp., Strain OXSARD2" /LENGTH=223 /DNA_ID=CAMNT_0010851139 /DNA_START=1043 /DNA_END=1714 /DNA_ORIENTATION=+
MCNYFSIGVESRIGLGFDKKRTSSICCNKCCYFCEGLKKFMCCRGRKRTLKIKEVVSHITCVDDKGVEKILFASNNEKESDFYVKGDPVSIFCTNIHTIMGGQGNLWDGGRNRDLGVVDGAHKDIKKGAIKLNDEVSHNDDKLEIEIASSILHLSLNKPNRVAQERGPIIIHFKDLERENDPITTYFQIDGEFYKMQNPMRIEISLNSKLKELKLLKNIKRQP